MPRNNKNLSILNTITIMSYCVLALTCSTARAAFTTSHYSRFVARRVGAAAASAASTQTATTTTTRRFLATDGEGSNENAVKMPYDEDKMPFYALGTNLAVQVGGQANFNTILEEDELDIALTAFCDTLRGNNEDPRTILTTYGPQLNQILQERTSKIMDKVKQDGKDFMADFLKDNEEATQTESGLVYCPTKEGDGASPTIQSTVEVHYHGTLTDGTVFDSSVDRGQTISFPLSGVISGWQEGLQLMKEGGKATLVVPSDLAYGDAGSGEVIPPGATLQFSVELFKVS